MQRNDRHRRMWLLCLLLTAALWVMSGCQTQPAQEPTSAPSPEPPTVTVAPPTPEPTAPPPLEPTLTELRTFPRVTVEELQQWMAAGERLFFVDARSAVAWDAATTKVPGALRVPPHEDIEPYLDKIPKDQRVVIYCT